MSRLDLLTVGEAFEDVVFSGLTRLPRLGEELRVSSLTRHPGGGAILTAIGAARLGLSVATLTATSAANVARLRAERIAVSNLRQRGEEPAVSVALSTARDRAFVTFEGVNTVLESRLIDALARLRRVPRHVHLALSPRACRLWLPVLARLRERGASTSWDFGWHAALVKDRALALLLAAVDWVFVNESEARLYTRTRTLAESVRRWGSLARGVVIKRGARGALVLGPHGVAHLPATRVAVVDTTGAGDAFNAGFIAGLLAGRSSTQAARLGNLIGGQSTRLAGGVSALPQLAELPRWASALMGQP